MTIRRSRLLGGLVAVALLLGACGSSSDDSSGSSPSGSSGSSGSASADGSTTVSTTTIPLGPPTSALSEEPDEGPFAPGRTPLTGFGEIEVRIVDGPDGEPIIICVLVADTPEEQQRGLMHVTDLGGYDGMLFQFGTDSTGGFWMKDTLLPLSIAYLAEDGSVVSTADMDPCPEGEPCPSYPADDLYWSALEVEQGGLDELGLVEGSTARLEVSGPCQPLQT